MTKSQLLQIDLGSLDILDEREKRVIQERIGPPVRSLEEVAKRFGLSRERVRQIENSADEKLKHSSN
ncbi:MAG: hypothetical protein AUH91_00080 [Verrucomicrobia bacterium 13_1_40CM_4_54_4]|nr:MAG: hypothetical protein AUH91_00080 [Verrucomicrobia bacterium 13_1_40CM_4_54_4]